MMVILKVKTGSNFGSNIGDWYGQYLVHDKYDICTLYKYNYG